MGDDSLQCQVLVIGAGPAGAAAALAAARAGADVLMLDRKRVIGRPVQCAGLVPAPASRFMDGDSGSIIAGVSGLRTTYPGGASELVSAPGFIIDRERFDRMLVERAVAAGARMLSACRARPSVNGARAVRPGAERLEVSARVIVGADGPRSAVGCLIGSVNRHYIHAIQQTFLPGKALDAPLILFDRKLPGGYGWLFPAGDRVRAGIGLESRSGISLRQALEYFIEKMSHRGLLEGRPIEVSGGLVPVGGPLTVHKDNIVLAGDAAGLTNPLTGSGVMSALISGELAGEAAAAAVSSGGTGPLEDYAVEIHALLGESLIRAREDRLWLSGCSREGESAFIRGLRAAWPLAAAGKPQAEEEVKISKA